MDTPYKIDVEHDQPSSTFSLIPFESSTIIDFKGSTRFKEDIEEEDIDHSNLSFNSTFKPPLCRRNTCIYLCPCLCLIPRGKSIIEILESIPRTYRIIVLTAFSAFMIITSVCVGIVALSNGATPYFIFSYIPYFFMALLIFACGIPLPFKNWDEESFEAMDLYSDINNYAMARDIQQFLLGTFSSGPFFICLVITITLDGSWIVVFMYMSHVLIILTSLLYLFIFFTPKGYKDIFKEGDEDEDVL